MRYPTSPKSTISKCENLTKNNIANNSKEENKRSNLKELSSITLYKEHSIVRVHRYNSEPNV